MEKNKLIRIASYHLTVKKDLILSNKIAFKGNNQIRTNLDTSSIMNLDTPMCSVQKGRIRSKTGKASSSKRWS